MMNKFPKDIILDFPLTLFSGQTFSWQYIDGSFYGSFQDDVVKIKNNGEDWFWQTYPKKDNFSFIQSYFNLNENYTNILEKLNHDEHLVKAKERYSGIRILNQDLVQTAFSFILAQNKNIQSIRRSLQFLSEKYGKSTKIDGLKIYHFPTHEFFKDISMNDLINSGVGYRARYIKDLAEKFNTNELQEVNNPRNTLAKKKERLKNVVGIGDKVADCILVFGLGERNITPIDIWSERVISELYMSKVKNNYKSKSEWFSKRFKENTALAGQFLFEYIRNYKPEKYY